MGVDPLASKFAGYSPYNYTLNNPINMIDPDGRAPEYPIYGKFGKLTGWVVERGEGPTQIAEKLNTFYSCQLSCEADFSQIVYDNRPNFEKVFNKDGSIENKYSGEYRSGTIDPGDVLEITIGKLPNQEQLETDFVGFNFKIDSVDDRIKEGSKLYGLRVDEINRLGTPSYNNDRLSSGGAGAAIGNTVFNELYAKPEIEREKGIKQKFIDKRDSVKKILEHEGSN